MEIEDLLIKITGILDKLKIPYIITGGMAVSVWGRTRYTADIDIVVELLEKNIESVPGLSGVSNHQGSKATEDKRVMEIILKDLKKRNLFFFDSRI